MGVVNYRLVLVFVDMCGLGVGYMVISGYVVEIARGSLCVLMMWLVGTNL